jgi:hypothetical protein
MIRDVLRLRSAKLPSVVRQYIGRTSVSIDHTECTLFDRNLPIDAVSEFHRLVAEKLGVPLTEWYTVVDRNTAINIMRRTAWVSLAAFHMH